MYRIRGTVKCYLFLIVTRFLRTHSLRSKPIIKTHLYAIVSDTKTLSGSISEVIGKLFLHIGKNLSKARFSGYCFSKNTNIEGDFKICISVPLIMQISAQADNHKYRKVLQLKKMGLKIRNPKFNIFLQNKPDNCM